MIAFGFVATLLATGALLYVLPPLFSRMRPGGDGVDNGTAALLVHRDQLAELARDLRRGDLTEEQFRTARADLEHRVAVEVCEGGSARVDTPVPRAVAWTVALLLPAMAAAIYAWIGGIAALEAQVGAPTPAAADHGLTRENVVQMAERLAARLKADPENGEGWAMLARSYNALGRHPEAVGAYRQALARVPDSPQLLVDYADTLAVTRGRKLAGEPFDLVQRALALDPRHLKALALAGTAELEAGRPAQAIDYWDRVLQQVPAGSDLGRSITGSIAEARRLVAAGTGASTPTNAASTANAVVTGTVVIDEALRARVQPGDTLFVFARGMDGSRMPLAILRLPVERFPQAFRLDDSMDMGQGRRLSKAGRVVIGARVSRAGSAAARSGDIEGVSEPVAIGAAGVVVRLDRTVP